MEMNIVLEQGIMINTSVIVNYCDSCGSNERNREKKTQYAVVRIGVGLQQMAVAMVVYALAAAVGDVCF